MLNEIIADIEQTLEKHGMKLIRHNHPQLPEGVLRMLAQNRPNPHPDAHPDGLVAHPEKHPEPLRMLTEEEETREERLVRKKAAFLKKLNQSQALG